MKQTDYVLGFMFSEGLDAVALIRKSKPAWQKGYLNGIGGKIEAGETPRAAMVREFAEETGWKTKPGHWIQFLVMRGEEFAVHCFCTAGPVLELVTQDVQEPVTLTWLAEVSALRARMIGNLPWIIFLGLDRLKDTNLAGAEVTYL